MVNHSLIFLALFSFSIVSNAAKDADVAVDDASLSAVLHKDLMVVQGREVDKDVAKALAGSDPESVAATSAVSALSERFAAQSDEEGLHPLAVLMLIIGLVVFFLSCKSSSTK